MRRPRHPRILALAATLLAPACGEVGDASGGTDAGTDAGGTGEEPRPPECSEDPAVCGDGVVSPGEACDEANEDGSHACGAGCVRDPVIELGAYEGSLVRAGFVKDDGSAVVVFDSPELTLLRISADGSVAGTTVLELPAGKQYGRGRSVHVGEGITVVGDVEQSGSWSGVIWTLDADGNPTGTELAPEGGSFGPADLAADGGLVVMTGGAVLRRGPDGSTVWSGILAEDGVGFQGLTITDDDVVFAVGGRSGAGLGVIARVTADAVELQELSSPELPGTYLTAVDAMPDGGAVAVGSTVGGPLLVRVDADGEVQWSNECLDPGAGAETLRVQGDEILLGGRRWAPSDGCSDACPGDHWMWVQHLGLDGQIRATDFAPSTTEYLYQSVLALGRVADGVRVLGVEDVLGSMLARFPG